MIIQKKRELWNLQPKKKCENISFNYDRTESDLSAVNENFLVQNN
jgi:hypothetical protein